MQQTTQKIIDKPVTHSSIAKRVIKRIRGKVRYLMHQKIWCVSNKEALINSDIKSFLNPRPDYGGEVNVNFIYSEMMQAMDEIPDDLSYLTMDELEQIEKLIQVYSIIDHNKK
jgi:hypothetical protein